MVELLQRNLSSSFNIKELSDSFCIILGRKLVVLVINYESNESDQKFNKRDG